MVCVCDGEQLMGNNNNNQERLMNMAAIANSATYSSTSLTAAKAEQLKCPRCDSSNTKFCYYNNYSLSQPRHLCKACKRYWTRGGTLRNVPVGGGCRKNKRVKRRNASSSNASPCVGLPKMGPDPRRPASLANPNLPVNHYPDPLSSSSHDLNSLFFGVTSNINPQLSALGFGGFPNFFLNTSDTNYSGFNGSDDQLKGPKIEEYNQSLLPSHANLSADDNVIMGNPVDGGMDQWQANCPFEALNYNATSASIVNGASSDSISYIYWNNSTMGSPGWPDPSSNSSVAPLI